MMSRRPGLSQLTARTAAPDASRARQLFHGTSLGALLGVVATVSAGAAPVTLLLAWSLAYLAAALMVEVMLRWADLRRRRVHTAGEVDRVVRGIRSTELLIASANRIELVSGTLKTFTERSANIRALHDRCRDGAEVRVLLMAPGKDGARLMAQERRPGAATTQTEFVDQQIVESLRRLADEFPSDVLTRVVRLYPTIPHASVQRYGDTYVVTLYTFGRGGSSPALALQRSGHEDFCDALDRGFAELWNAQSTVRMDQQMLKRLGIRR